MSTKKTCFIISPIGDDGTEIRKRADQVLKHVITPAVSSAGYDPVRADKISEPGMITGQVIQHIVDSPLVIADLTGMNPNVFYELAVRHAIRKPLVQIIQKGEKIPFDVAGMRTIGVDHRDLDSVEEAKVEIQKQIKAVEGKKPEQIESPISVSIELQSLKQSDRPEDRTLAEFVSALSQLRSDVSAIDKKLSDPSGLVPPNYLRDVIRAAGGGILDKRMFLNIEEIRHALMELRHEIDEKDPKGRRASIERATDRLEHLMFDLRRGIERG
jgi:hypothetical protein